MYPAEMNAKTAVERRVTLNDRLNKLSEALQYQCERIESVMRRVNGGPHDGTASGRAGGATPITPTLPLTTVIDHLEGAQARLADLATQVENIA